MAESELHGPLQMEIGKHDGLAWRNNSGVAVYPDGSRVRYGVGVGGSDFLGILTVTVTPEMVGAKVGIFLAVEAKAKRGRSSDDQERFLALVKKRGGVALLVRSVEDLRAGLATVPGVKAS